MKLLDELRAQLKKILDERAAAQTEVDAVIAAAETEGRSEFNEDETAKFTEARAKIVGLDEQRKPLEERIAELEAQDEACKAAEALAATLPKGEGTTTVRVGKPELTYRQDGEHHFLTDAFNARYNGDGQAAQRLARNAEEQRGEFGVEKRDVGTSAFAGLVVPQYLVDLWAPVARAGRPVANSVPKVALPSSGMTLNVSRITTGSAVAAQATENSAVQETNIDDTLLTVNVRTYAGQQDVSRQAIERGEIVEQVVMGDLVADYHTKLDAAIVSGAGTSGTHEGILTVSGIDDTDYTDASPTVAEMWPKLANAVQKVNSNRYAPATVIYMHPRRWGWITAALDSQNRPLFGAAAADASAVNSVAVGQAAQYGQVVGSILGLPVITDANIPTNLGAGTNEDAIIVSRNLDYVLFEEGDGEPRFLRFEETLGDQLTIKLVVFAYSAFTAGRYPKSTSTVTDTGLVTPTF